MDVTMGTTDDDDVLASPLEVVDLHDHCLFCVNQRCTDTASGVSCPMVNCHLACGAVFHFCKAQEHCLLCPLEKVPCLNWASGCPVTLVRRKMASHLEVCPAGVVCCTMNWKKWTVGVPDCTLPEIQSREGEGTEQLDLALTLQDLRALESIKAVVAERGEPVVEQGGAASLAEPSSSSKLYDATVKMARSLAAALGVINGGSPDDDAMEWKDHGGAPQDNGAGGDERGEFANGLEATGVLNGEQEHDVRQGWLRVRVKTAHRISEANITEVENGQLSGRRGDTMEGVIAQGTSCQQSLPPILPPAHFIQGSTPRAGHVVVENKRPVLLEDQDLMCKLQMDHPLSDPSSFAVSYGMTVPISEGSFSQPCPHVKDKAVDTSELFQEDPPVAQDMGSDVDPATATLPLSSEESRRHGTISDALYVGCHHGCVSTQTSAHPVGGLPPKPVPDMGRQHVVPIMCGQPFRRDQFCSHFTNVHADIHAGIDGWMEHHCPLAYYGCPFTQLRLRPSTEGARVIQDRHLKAYGLQMCPGIGPENTSQSDQLSGLPAEILWHIAGFLDSFSLCQLAMVSRTMREVCTTLLQTKGIVELQWERRPPFGTGGTMSWQVKGKAWSFSRAFSPVPSWRFADVPSMSDHLRRCRFNIIERKTKPVPMPSMCPGGAGRYLRRGSCYLFEMEEGNAEEPCSTGEAERP